MSRCRHCGADVGAPADPMFDERREQIVVAGRRRQLTPLQWSFLEELLIAFLPDDRKSFELALKRVKKSKRLSATHLARFADFDAIFDAVVAVKEKRGVVNSGLALLVMAELAMERLHQLEQIETLGEAAA